MPSVAERERPSVPNHELVRVIGRGAYGEIWMARSLTGALRAIKIVDRRNFENEKAFQREFEGMARFEPISRSDSGFVDILHVGRDDGGHFFYYVMELADDVTGASSEPADYVPKTLRTELARRSRLLVHECLDIGLSLTRALNVLHRQGLVHRDIKPANVIFVGGVPKIADIGLVAASGQNSFVGTEGYVPPEGPGSVQADLYSLGKVLYEIAMGKDRLDFPELHTDLTDLPEREHLLQLNGLLLRACASDLRERYATAEEMLGDLLRVQSGRPLRRSRSRAGVLVGVAVTLLLAGTAGAWRRQHQPGAIIIKTDPPDAHATLDGKWQECPAEFDDVSGGKHVIHVIHPDFLPTDVTVEVAPHKRTTAPVVHLARALGEIQVTSAPPGAEYVLRKDGETVKQGVTPADLKGIATGEYDVTFSYDGRNHDEHVSVHREEAAAAAAEFNSAKLSVNSTPAGAEILVDGKDFGKAPLELTVPEGAHEVVARYKSWPEQHRSVEITGIKPGAANFEFKFGSLKLTSAPSGATVEQGGKELHKTPMVLEELEPGKLEYELRLGGYKAQRVSVEIKPDEQTFYGAHLIQRQGPQRGQKFENTLSMRFLPLGDVLMCIWPTRVRDYAAFIQATGRSHTEPDFNQDSTCPVVHVNWEDATAFCEWLTQKEQRSQTIEPGQLYRLPTDAEWSAGAGMPVEAGNTPEERDGKLRDYPWGRQFPPPSKWGNFADSSLKRGLPRIPGYKDGFPQTSPAESFLPNRLGFFDMGGNVWQWVQDTYKGDGHGKEWGVLRGGSWATYDKVELRTSYRNVVDRAEHDVIFGFRVVLVPQPDS